MEEPATLLKLTLLHGYSSRFLNCTNATKSRNASHLYINDYPTFADISVNLMISRNFSQNEAKSLVF